MRFEMDRLEKSVGVLMDKAEDCLDLAKTQHATADQQHDTADKLDTLAKTQHEIADKQHASADKLDTLGQALTADAVELKGEMEIAAGRSSPRMRERPDPK